jgi:hypothetical protein
MLFHVHYPVEKDATSEIPLLGVYRAFQIVVFLGALESKIAGCSPFFFR